MATRTTHRPATVPVPTAPEATQLRPTRVWWRVFRHHLRLLRNTSIAWIVALAGIGTGLVGTFDDRYGTEAELRALAEMEGVPAFEALVGRYVEPATVEGLTLSRWGMFGILVAVWGMLAAVRLLRGAEEAGHVEPLRAGALTPRGLLTASLAALFTVYVIFAVAIGASHSAVGMDSATSWALGGAVALLAATFAAAGALASQLVAARRRAVGIAGSFLGIGIAAMGLAPRVTAPLTYGLAVAAFLLDFVGGFLDLPEAVMDASPFRHLAAVPAVDIDVVPALIMLAVGLLGIIVGVLAFRRRDLQEA